MLWVFSVKLPSILVQVMASCRQACKSLPEAVLNCLPWSMSLYGVTRPQWVKWMIATSRFCIHWSHSNDFIFDYFTKIPVFLLPLSFPPLVKYAKIKRYDKWCFLCICVNSFQWTVSSCWIRSDYTVNSSETCPSLYESCYCPSLEG